MSCALIMQQLDIISLRGTVNDGEEGGEAKGRMTRLQECPIHTTTDRDTVTHPLTPSLRKDNTKKKNKKRKKKKQKEECAVPGYT